MAPVHLVVTPKGGVGKSLVAALLVQYQRRGGPVLCLDCDPWNGTLLSYAGLRASPCDVVDGGVLSAERCAALARRVAEERGAVVVDTAGALFVPLLDWLLRSATLQAWGDSGHDVFCHAIVSGGLGLLDCLNGVDSLGSQLPAAARLVVWLNEFFGEIEVDGRVFEEMAVYARHQERIAALVRLSYRPDHGFGGDLRWMLRHRLTFDEVRMNAGLDLLGKQRLTMVERDVREQLALFC